MKVDHKNRTNRERWHFLRISKIPPPIIPCKRRKDNILIVHSATSPSPSIPRHRGNVSPGFSRKKPTFPVLRCPPSPMSGASGLVPSRGQGGSAWRISGPADRPPRHPANSLSTRGSDRGTLPRVIPHAPESQSAPCHVLPPGDSEVGGQFRRPIGFSRDRSSIQAHAPERQANGSEPSRSAVRRRQAWPTLR